MAKGITGKLTMLDGKTGRPRTVIDVERAALLCAKEGPPALCTLREPSTSFTHG